MFEQKTKLKKDATLSASEIMKMFQDLVKGTVQDLPESESEKPSVESLICEVARGQAWERAKGELQALLGTYYGLPGEIEYSKIAKEVEDFVEKLDNLIYE